MNVLLGAHLSTSGGYQKAIEKLISMGGNCLQTFAGSPRTWQQKQFTPETKKLFCSLQKQYNIRASYFHACYLINLADPGETGKKSVNSLIHELRLASETQVKGSIVHTGSFKNGKNEKHIEEEGHFPTLTNNLKTILSETPSQTFLILENSGTRKIGKRLEDLATLLETIQDKRLKICLDTCHLHAAGYDLTTQESFERFIKRFDELMGLSNLEVVHVNDSKDTFGSLRDRHENIGKGNVGIQVFRNFLTHPKTKHLTFITETPGFDGNGPDKENLDILISLKCTKN